MTRISIIAAILILVASCAKKSDNQSQDAEADQTRSRVELVTTKGAITLELYNETPKHRDNFLKLAKDGAFDSLLFHRVIKNFMIQGGDPESKYAKVDEELGSGDIGYTVDAEFHKDLFHKKGALAAARDGNLARASSGIQFYIVQGKVFTDSLLDISENRINTWLAAHYFKNDPANKALTDSLQAAIEREDYNAYSVLNDSISKLADAYDNFERYTIPTEHREVYKTIGGTPHLDQNYTVYGEVVEGLSIVDSVAAVRTNRLNRPLDDVRILSARVLTD